MPTEFMAHLIRLLRQINNLLATVAGLALLACVLYTILDIAGRYLGKSLGGSDEVSGYIMAIVSSWGVCYALTSLAHVRIDLFRNRLVQKGRALLDTVSLLLLCVTANVIAYWTWRVLKKSIDTSARANTPLETPLWIPQFIWWSGWVWFAVSSTLLMIAVVYYWLQGNLQEVENTAGVGSNA